MADMDLPLIPIEKASDQEFIESMSRWTKQEPKRDIMLSPEKANELLKKSFGKTYRKAFSSLASFK